jgi:hypothetical protein
MFIIKDYEYIYIVARSLKAKIVESQQPAVTRQRPVNNNREMLVSVRSMSGLYHEFSGVFWGFPLRGGGFEYLHRSLASRRRRRKGNAVPEGITGPPCSWGT